MAIRDRIDDALFLAAHSRFDGALMSVLVAIEALARLRYPVSGRAMPDWQKCRRPAQPLVYSQRRDASGQPAPMAGGCAFQFFLRDEFASHGLPKYVVHVGARTTARPCPLDPPFPQLKGLTLEETARALDEYQAAEEEARAKFDLEMIEYNREIEPQMWAIEEVLWTLCRCKLCHLGRLAEEVAFYDSDSDSLAVDLSSGMLRLNVTWVRMLIQFAKDSPEYKAILAKSPPNKSNLWLLP